MRKWGHATNGEQWDTVQEEDTWYEKVANVSWADAYRHSPPLLNVKPRLPGTAGRGGAGDGEGGGGEEGGEAAAGPRNVMRPLSLRKKKPTKKQ